MTTKSAVPLQGRRVMPDENGLLDTKTINTPGSYGQATHKFVKGHPRQGWWQITCPDGTSGSINPDIHQVIEHSDGTITVSPSLDYSKLPWRGWHGWLKKGVFIEA